MRAYHPHRQLWLLAILAIIGTIGVALPYPIFAPLLLHPAHGSIIPGYWPNSSRSIVFGVLLATYPLGVFLGSAVLGGLSDFYGRRKLIIGTLFSAALGYVVTAFALHIDNLYLLLLGRFFTGFVEGNISIVRSAVADMPNINKHRGFGIIGGATTIGFVIGPLLGGTLSDSRIISWFTFSTPFYFSSLIVLLGGILALVFLHEPTQSRQHQNVTQSLSKQLSEHFNIIHRLRLLCRNRSLKFLFITSFCFFFAIDTYYEFYPAFLVKMWNMQSLSIAILTAVLSFGLTLGNVWLSRFLSERFKTVPTIFCHILLYASTLVAILFTTKISLLYVLFIFSGIFIGVSANHFYVEISKTASEDQQGQALGMGFGLRMLGDAAISFAGGFLIIVSSTLPLVVSIVMAVIAVLLVSNLA